MQTLTLNSTDGHTFTVSVAQPQEEVRGAIIVIQEVFGVNDNIKYTLQRYADSGYVAIAPHVFDRLEPELVIPYSEIQTAMGKIGQLDQTQVDADVAATIEYAKQYGKVAIVGFCWGGKQSFIAACQQPVDVAISYYGGGIAALDNLQPKCPIQFHFANHDKFIPTEHVDAIAQRNPHAELYRYDADHGFSCKDRASFNAASDELAHERSLAFLHQHLSQ